MNLKSVVSGVSLYFDNRQRRLMKLTLLWACKDLCWLYNCIVTELNYELWCMFWSWTCFGDRHLLEKLRLLLSPQSLTVVRLLIDWNSHWRKVMLAKLILLLFEGIFSCFHCPGRPREISVCWPRKWSFFLQSSSLLHAQTYAHTSTTDWNRSCTKLTWESKIQGGRVGEMERDLVAVDQRWLIVKGSVSGLGLGEKMLWPRKNWQIWGVTGWWGLY